MGLKTVIWSSRLGKIARRIRKEKESDEEEKFLLICESIGHWPLRGRCPPPPKKGGRIINAIYSYRGNPSSQNCHNLLKSPQVQALVALDSERLQRDSASRFHF